MHNFDIVFCCFIATSFNYVQLERSVLASQKQRQQYVASPDKQPSIDTDAKAKQSKSEEHITVVKPAVEKRSSDVTSATEATDSQKRQSRDTSSATVLTAKPTQDECSDPAAKHKATTPVSAGGAEKPTEKPDPPQPRDDVKRLETSGVPIPGSKVKVERQESQSVPSIYELPHFIESLGEIADGT